MNGWRQEARRAIRDYPALRQRLNDMHETSITQKYAPAMPGGGDSRTVEAIALRDLPPKDARRLRAVELAIETTKRYTDHALRLRLVSLVFWQRSHTVTGAAVVLCVSEGTAKAWSSSFVELVDAYLRVLP